MASTPILTSKARSAIDKENILVHSTTKPNVTQGNPIPPAKRLRRNEFVESQPKIQTPPSSFPSSSISQETHQSGLTPTLETTTKNTRFQSDGTRTNDFFSSRSNIHAPPSFLTTSSIPLSDTTNVWPSIRPHAQQSVRTPTFDSSKSRLTAKDKRKGKVVASGKRAKTNHAIKEPLVGVDGDGYSSEENDESIYRDYEGASEEYGEQHYDCSSEESDIESKLRVNFNDKSKERDIVAPANSTTSSKGKNKVSNTALFLKMPTHDLYMNWKYTVKSSQFNPILFLFTPPEETKEITLTKSLKVESIIEPKEKEKKLGRKFGKLYSPSSSSSDISIKALSRLEDIVNKIDFVRTLILPRQVKFKVKRCLSTDFAGFGLWRYIFSSERTSHFAIDAAIDSLVQIFYFSTTPKPLQPWDKSDIIEDMGSGKLLVQRYIACLSYNISIILFPPTGETSTIGDVAHGSSWYYIGSGGYHTKATKGPTTLMCKKCGKTDIVGVAQYLAKISVYDNDDQSSFVLFGDAGHELSGKKASELVARYFEANENVGDDHLVPVPQALIDTIGQTRKFIVKLIIMNHQPHVSYSFSSEIEPATTDPDRQLNIKIKRKNTSQTEINFSIKFSTTENGHITDDTADLMEHMFSYHVIYFPVSGEITEYTSHKFASMIPSLTDYAGTNVRAVLSIRDFNPTAINRIDLDLALIDLRASIRQPIPEDADKVCSICQDKLIGTGVVNSLKCNHIYHHLCIVEWIRHNLRSPTCRDTHF
ncbi:unnamed protein product [Brassica napus]|uniref:(rape) hypothetical protein n=2 Tax=Brassica napus TaxID=3708 RepID=A0A816L7K9_BRANA|nr:unnamed protein product [Brassica napus]